MLHLFVINLFTHSIIINVTSTVLGARITAVNKTGKIPDLMQLALYQGEIERARSEINNKS